MTAQINLQTLSAVALAASTEETRFYLNGVFLQIDADGATYVATDGHILIATRETLPEDAERNTTLGAWIIPSDQCKVKLSRKEDPKAELSFADGRVTITHKGASKSFLPIDATYPDWIRVVPRGPGSTPLTNGENAPQFNPALLERIRKAGAIMGGESIHVHYQSGGNPCPVTWPGLENAFAVVMPLYSKAGEWRAPNWLK